MSPLSNSPNRRKIIVCYVLATLTTITVLAFVIVGHKNNVRSDTLKVGSSSIQSDPRSFPDYKTGNGDRVTILEKEKLSPYLNTLALNEFEIGLKSLLYEKTSTIPSVASLVSKVSKNKDGTLGFRLQTDVSNTIYQVLIKTDGSILELKPA